MGFIGLGIMGQPMALNLLRAGTPLLVWNRSVARAEPLHGAGACVASSADEVFERCDVVILMLRDEPAIDAVLQRGGPRFSSLVRGRTVVQMGTVSTRYSLGLADEIAAAGGNYVEAPVSGSRGPAEAGTLIGMLAGEPAVVASLRPLLAPMCSELVDCGAVPSALAMKFAVNVFLITQVTGLAESFHFAEANGLDTAVLARVLNAGPMASAVSRGKADKLVHADLSPHASLTDVLKNARLITDAAADAGMAAPLMVASEQLYAEAVAAGHGAEDMAGVIVALRARSASGAV